MVISIAKIVNLHIIIFTLIIVRHNFLITSKSAEWGRGKVQWGKIRFDYDTEKIQEKNNTIQ